MTREGKLDGADMGMEGGKSGTAGSYAYLMYES